MQVIEYSEKIRGTTLIVFVRAIATPPPAARKVKRTAQPPAKPLRKPRKSVA